MLSNFLTLDIVNVFPFVDEVLIQYTLQEAYEDYTTPQSLIQVNARACIFALYALMSTHFNQEDASTVVNAEDYAREAKRLLIWGGIEEPTIITLQTATLLVSK